MRFPSLRRKQEALAERFRWLLALCADFAGRAENNVARFEEAVPILREAIACQDALVIFRDRKMDDLAASSTQNLAEARALLAELQ